MASKVSHDLGYYTYAGFEKLKTLFNGDKGRTGIIVTTDLNVPDWNNLLVTIESDKYPNKIRMLDTFANILAVEVLDGVWGRKK